MVYVTFLFVSDPSIGLPLRRLWLEGAERVGVDVLEAPAHCLGVRVEKGKVEALLDGVPFCPEAVVLRTAGVFMPLIVTLAEVWGREGVPVVNDARATQNARDKLRTALILEKSGVPFVPTTGFFRGGDVPFIEGEVVVKPAFGSRGRGVELYDNRERASQALGSTVTAPTEQHLVAQPFYGPRGHDLRLFVIEGRCVAGMRRRAAPGGFLNNASQGASVEALVEYGEAGRLAEAAAIALGLTYAGVDILETEHPVVLEVNALPSFVALSEATGVNPAEEIWRIVQRLARRAA